MAEFLQCDLADLQLLQVEPAEALLDVLRCCHALRPEGITAEVLVAAMDLVAARRRKAAAAAVAGCWAFASDSPGSWRGVGAGVTSIGSSSTSSTSTTFPADSCRPGP